MAGRTMASKDILVLTLGSCDYGRLLHGQGTGLQIELKLWCLLSHIIQMSLGAIIGSFRAEEETGGSESEKL